MHIYNTDHTWSPGNQMRLMEMRLCHMGLVESIKAHVVIICRVVISNQRSKQMMKLKSIKWCQ